MASKSNSNLRFDVGAAVMCNLGPSGWKLGRIIALHYREDPWPAGRFAPYQVALEGDHSLIYVPEDDDRYCREPTPEDLRIARRTDALAALPPGTTGTEAEPAADTSRKLGCRDGAAQPGSAGYRRGRCHCCDPCPRSWSAAELYSEHYRCAARNGLRVTRRSVDLGRVYVGDDVHHPAGDDLPSGGGFMQCPTLVRLPPGVRFSDDGALAGQVRFDPHRDATYRVNFVAVSTAQWDDPALGIVRLEITFVVEGNEPPAGFDVGAFMQEQQRARLAATRMLRELGDTWERWERGELNNRDTCDQMCSELSRLRELLEVHPRLDGGRWWAQLGGYHMNVHKLLEDTLFECELYLGHALTFGDAEVRSLAEANLEGCYQKRLLEAARFMWMDGAKQMMDGEWAAAAETLRLAAAKKDGWGWAVNHGDIWLAEAAARLVHGAELEADSDAAQWIAEAARLLHKAVERAEEARIFGPEGHPWAAEIDAALAEYQKLQSSGADVADWLDAFRHRTAYWCAQVLGGATPFPPAQRARLADADALLRRLPGHNTEHNFPIKKDSQNDTGDVISGSGFRFDTTYTELPAVFHQLARPSPGPEPRVTIANEPLARELGLRLENLAPETQAALFSGLTLAEGSAPFSQAYAGHQFGGFSILGDGRAHVLGEHVTPDGRRVDVQLKGSGPTPYSRGGDGLATLGPMLREYIISEAMAALRVPTTRSLAVVSTGATVLRERPLPGAVLTRVAASHLRIGTFEFAAHLDQTSHLRELVQYAIDRHYPELASAPRPAVALWDAVARRQATLIAAWMRVGFVHGVMNTDNVSIAGETIDYGPCAFIDRYAAGTVFSSIDSGGRYAFGNQPWIARWNLARFAEALLPLIDADRNQAIEVAHERLAQFRSWMNEAWTDMMRDKLGLPGQREDDLSLATALLELMEETSADYTDTFRALSGATKLPPDLARARGWSAWRARWDARCDRAAGSEPSAAARDRMSQANPAVIPRNYLVEEALEAAVESADLEPLTRLLAALQSPYEERAELAPFQQLPPDSFRNYTTFCGT